MASKPSIVEYLRDQLSEAGEVSVRKMFGDYGVFLSGKMIALICDDQLFFKPTDAGRRLFPAVTEGIPYPGARPCLLVPEEAWEDREWLARVARATFQELPIPKKKTVKA